MGEQVPRGFWVAAREEPERVALVDADGRAWTAGQLLAGANQLVHALRSRGVQPFDPVATLTRNSAELFQVLLAVFQGGWQYVPLNIPNEGQVADLPLGAMVESMCIVDGGGVRGSEAVSLPAGMAEALRRVSASQELTVDAAVRGDRDAAFTAMLLDPLAGRGDYDDVAAMTDEMLAATAEWLPQFPRP